MRGIKEAAAAAAEKCEIVEEARIVRACANLCYCLFHVCVYVCLPSSPFTPPLFQFLISCLMYAYRWHKNLFSPWQKETERVSQVV